MLLQIVDLLLHFVHLRHPLLLYRLPRASVILIMMQVLRDTLLVGARCNYDKYFETNTLCLCLRKVTDLNSAEFFSNFLLHLFL